MSLPQSVRQHIQQFIEHQPAIQQLFQQLPSDLRQVIQTPEGFLAIIATVVLGLACLAALIGGRKRKGSSVVLVGPVNSGKTTLFYQLKNGERPELVASMQENGALCSVNGKAVRILDIPGHHSFRNKLESSLREAAGVVFLIDAVEITPNKVEAADMLYEVLINPIVQKQRLPVLIACNKADLEEEAHSVDFIRKTLEKQLDAMRKTKTAAIGKDAASQAPALGALDRPFSLQGLRNKVLLAECSALQGQLSDVKYFISSCLR